MRSIGVAIGILVLAGTTACGGEGSSMPASASGLADVTAVVVTGDPGAYTFAVTIASPDTGCDAYADWWEVITPEGALVYRRVLAHSHVDEQPFTRSGGPVDIMPGRTVYVRAHFSRSGYGGAVQAGSPSGAFDPIALDRDFASAIAQVEPLPTDCAF